MFATMLNINLFGLNADPALIGFLLIAIPLLCLLAFDHSKHAKTLAKAGSPKQTYLAPYRDADGMPVFFDLDTYSSDSPAYSTRQKRYQSRTNSR